MNFKIFQIEQTSFVAIVPQTAHSTQPKSVSQTDQNVSYLAGIFVAFTIVGFILGCLMRYRKCKNQRYNRTVEMIREVATSDKIQKVTPDKELNMNPQIKKQIEVLEKIWKKSP